ncbi:MAG: hypothetical protein QNK36_21980 [Colwellia sp.]|nr:hypothetical protein [Colwellia sp.]
MFGDSTLFNFEFLDKINMLVRDENLRLENTIEIENEIFNQSNCQCQTEYYEFDFEQKMKKNFQSGVTQVGYELVIVGLYKHSELHLKSSVSLLLPNISSAKSKDYALLQSKLDDYQAIDELRLINNSIKHQGKVSPQLANSYSSWVLGDDLGDLSNVYERLKYKVKNYIVAHETYLKHEKLKYV